MKTSYKIALASAVGLFLIVVAYVSIPDNAPGETTDQNNAQTNSNQQSSSPSNNSDNQLASAGDDQSSDAGSFPSPSDDSSADTDQGATREGTDAASSDAGSGGEAVSIGSETRRRLAALSETGEESAGSDATTDEAPGAAGDPSASPAGENPTDPDGEDTTQSPGSSQGSQSDSTDRAASADRSGQSDALGTRSPSLGQPSPAQAGANMTGSTDPGQAVDPGEAATDNRAAQDGSGPAMTAESAGSPTTRTPGQSIHVGDSPENRTRADTDANPVPDTYTVQQGDSAWSIANKFYGSGTHWDAIAEANPNVDPTKINAGDKLRLPDRSTVGSSSSDDNDSEPATRQGNYTVKRGETLSDIAKKQYGDSTKWRRIYEANKRRIGQNPDRLEAGLRLMVPPAAEVANN